ncbi:hypothetical protein KC19_8G091500 [Ceratodon purpureus]|uniref:Uncharacterized protein n=1 Tax=Ceratodon purpureus TaxID=3225 RepID=A0A8T0H1D0_CERPU|nr:hypothetical protein KC19_8G091500 [Ceratodon purpureus]
MPIDTTDLADLHPFKRARGFHVIPTACEPLSGDLCSPIAACIRLVFERDVFKVRYCLSLDHFQLCRWFGAL